MPTGPSELSWLTLGHPDSNPPQSQSCPGRPAWGYMAPGRKDSLPYTGLLGGRTPPPPGAHRKPSGPAGHTRPLTCPSALRGAAEKALLTAVQAASDPAQPRSPTPGTLCVRG